MPETPENLEYSTKYSKQARPSRNALSASLRKTLDEIEDRLTDNPDGYPLQTISLSANMFVYQHSRPHLEVTYKIDREKKVISFMHIAAPMLEVSKPLFISYNHEDEKWLLELKKFLKPLEERDLISVWDDTEIKAGEDWRDKIEKALASAKVAVLLISQEFLTSDFIQNNELPSLLDSAKNEGLSILWIAVSSSTVDDSPISKYQAVIKDPLDILEPPQQKEAFVQIYNKIKEVVQVRDFL